MKKAIFLLVALLLLGGCVPGGLKNTSTHEGLIDEIPNDIPQQLKEVDHEMLSNAVPYNSKSYLDLLDSAFCDEGNVKEYYMKSHKVVKPGDQVEVRANSLPRDGRYEVRFAKFNNKERKFETILEQTVNRNDSNLVVTIPDEENVSYYLEEIQMNSKNEILKREIQRLFVLYEEVNARVDLDRAVYSPGDTVSVTIKNLGTVELETGYGVTVEKLDGENWVRYNFEQDVPLPLIILRSGGDFTQEFELKDFEKGTYRIIEGLPGGHKISAAFEVE